MLLEWQNLLVSLCSTLTQCLSLCIATRACSTLLVRTERLDCEMVKPLGRKFARSVDDTNDAMHLHRHAYRCLNTEGL